MPLYEFIDDDSGKMVERFYPAGKAPKIGKYIRGTSLRRLPPSLGVPAVDNITLTSHFFAPWQGCEFLRDGRKMHPTEVIKERKNWSKLIRSGQVRPIPGKNSAEHYDRLGNPVLRGKRRIKEFATRNGFEWGNE